MHVDFLLFHDGNELPSDRVLQSVVDLVPDFERTWDLEGRVSFTGDDLELQFDDTLVPFVQALLEGLLDLARTGHGRVSRTVEYGYLRMDVEGTWVRLGGDGVDSGRVEREPFLHGILGMVGRLVAVLKALGHGDSFDVRVLTEDRREVMKALAQPGWDEGGVDALPPLGPPPPREEAEGPVLFQREGTLSWHCDGKSVSLPGEAVAWLPIVETAIRPALEAGRSIVARFPSGYGYARFDAEGEQVRISGDGMPDLRLPLAGVLRSIG